MKKLMLGTAVALITSSTAFAQDYQFEVGASLLTGDMEGFGINAQLHMDKVDTSKGPLNEAAFLDKSSFIDLGLGSVEEDVPGADSETTIDLSGRFVTKSNIIIEAAYNDLGFDDAMSIGAGTYLNDNMDAVVTYETYDKSDFSALTGNIHGINKLEGEKSLAYDLGLGYIIDDGGDDSGYSISAGADYYLDNALSVGAGIELESATFDRSTIGLRANYFVTPVVRVGFSFESYGQDADGDLIELNAAMRF